MFDWETFWTEVPRYMFEFHFIFLADNYHGFLYRLEDDSKLLPIYDLNGYLSGIQAIVSIQITL